VIATPKPYPGRVRIIGGCWRGRLIDVPDAPGLRPTGSRIRETLFNWLMPVITGARCLDLFAGAGALGFEAASRGAAHVIMLDRDAAAIRHLRETAAKLDAGGVECVQADALHWLDGAAGPFDIVFVDPPFQSGLTETILSRLARPALLNPGAQVYLEADKRSDMSQLPPGWRIRREKVAGQVRYLLIEIVPAEADGHHDNK
jgi:16S rRNA (guanine966-N2)-methyltransferase